MLASTPTAEYVSLRASKCDHSVSPSPRYQTPPRFKSTYDSPMLTPSPLKRYAPPSAEPMDTEDIFQSPAASSSYTLNLRKDHSMQIPTDDEFDEDEGFLLAPPSSSFSRTLLSSTSPAAPRTPFRTPFKTPVRRTPDRPVLSVKPLNTPFTLTPSRGTGTKRKPPLISTPLRKRTLTPLNITSGTRREDDPDGMAFDRLAPLAAPRFVPKTPQSKAETEIYLKRQAETMTMLKISGLERHEESGYESGLGGEPEPHGHRLFLGGIRTPFGSVKGKSKAKAPISNSPGLEIFVRRGQANDEEVAEAVSPGGHVTKRRARSRPLSSELLESVQGTSVAFEFADQPQDKERARVYVDESPNSVAFPSRSRTSSTSSSETGSPIRRSRSRLPSLTMPRTRTQSQSRSRAPLNRLTSSSSATLFFGPSIPSPSAPPRSTQRAGVSTRANAVKGNGNAPPVASSSRLQMANRRSHPSSSECPSSWARCDPVSISPCSSPTRKRLDEDEEVDLFFSGGPPETSFAFSLTEGTPSPKKKQRREELSPLPKKFRPRDSGIALDDSDDEWGLPAGGSSLVPPMLLPSSSANTMSSDCDDALVTPVFPSAASGWPGVVSLDDELTSGRQDSGTGQSIDAFIIRALAAGATTSARGATDGEPKRVPGTPVKKVKTAHLVQRPWQSAVANKIGFPEFDDEPAAGAPKKGKGRKSLPAAFPILGKENRSTGKARARATPGAGGDTDAEDDEASPSTRKDGKYDGLGMGRPSVGAIPAFARPGGKTHWLMRRSSSGAFSSNSDTSNSASVTPTRNAKDWYLPPPRLPKPVSPLKNTLDFTQKRSTSGSSSGTSATNSPTVAAASRHLTGGTPVTPQRTPTRPSAGGLFAGLVRPHTQALPSTRGRPSLGSGDEQQGRFEREFEEIDELGRGQFGKVMKVRYKHGRAGEEVFAVKKSKVFEGVKHRLRLREEVDILQHLAQAGSRGHPNVLAYVDSWEEDETLYIRTELCALGNFGHFLWTYGRAFPRLDEGRVWRVLAELSSGLCFIHGTSVLHLDLKPANIFVTETGRLRIGDFGMAARWPRSPTATGGFEREGDKRYLAPEVLQGRYGKAADVFSLGLTMLETATNIVVPDQGDAWHRLRCEDFRQVQDELDTLSSALRDLLWLMMRSEPGARIEALRVNEHQMVRRARTAMERSRAQMGDSVRASAFGAVPDGFLENLLDDEWEDERMDVGL